jgi:urea carboxylase
VLVLEAMKMEHQSRAPADGLVAEVLVGPGDQVQAGDVLATVTEQDATARETASGADTARP